MLSNSSLLQVPRNFFFLKKLPKQFSICVLEKINTTPKGIWYLVQVERSKNNIQTMNLLSQILLEVGANYLIEKQEPLSLRIVKKKV